MLIQAGKQVKFYLCKVKATLIISVYKDVEALEAVLKTVVNQREKDVEVLISQDGDSDCFNNLLARYTSMLSIRHLQQPDEGFLKNKMLNRAVLAAKSDKIVFIDGDCILHPRFMDQYIRYIKPNRICMGRRIDLDPVTTAAIKQGKQTNPTILGMIKHKTTRVEERLFLPWKGQKTGSTPKCLGCNMGWYKTDLLRLNGFDEAYTYPGFGEDTDIEWRGKKAGMEVFSMRYKAIQYHLDHPRPDREDEVSKSQQLFESRKDRTDFRCQDGIEKLTD
jgi:cellulose synthase/poly-beta-1,6-N-acetylglucosamine synthase-like glycosyltransferase